MRRGQTRVLQGNGQGREVREISILCKCNIFGNIFTIDGRLMSLELWRNGVLSDGDPRWTRKPGKKNDREINKKIFLFTYLFTCGDSRQVK